MAARRSPQISALHAEADIRDGLAEGPEVILSRPYAIAITFFRIGLVLEFQKSVVFP